MTKPAAATDIGFGAIEQEVGELMSYDFPTLAIADTKERIDKLSSTKVIPWTKGTRIGGFYAGTKIIHSEKCRRKDNPSGEMYLHRMIDQKGQQFGIWGTGVLRSFFLGDERGAELPQGIFVALTYNGKVPHKSSPQGMHDFKIELGKKDLMGLLKPLKPVALAEGTQTLSLAEGATERVG